MIRNIKYILLFIVLLFGKDLFPLIPSFLFNINLNGLSNDMYILYQLSCKLGFIFILFLIYRKNIISDFKDYIKNFKKNFNNSFKYYMLGLVLMVLSTYIINTFFIGATPINDNAVREMIDLFPIYMIFSVGIYAPIVEELIFRKSIYDSVISFGNSNFHKIIYILSSGFIFALLHVLGMTNSNLDYLYIIPYMSLGTVFAFLYVKTNNIFSSISMHSLHNLVTIILHFLQGVI